jgi:hypothetical protein
MDNFFLELFIATQQERIQSEGLFSILCRIEEDKDMKKIPFHSQKEMEDFLWLNRGNYLFISLEEAGLLMSTSPFENGLGLN